MKRPPHADLSAACAVLKARRKKMEDGYIYNAMEVISSCQPVGRHML